MPKVGKKHFKYDAKGMKKAKDYAKKTGKKVKYSGGGMLEYEGGGKVDNGGKVEMYQDQLRRKYG